MYGEVAFVFLAASAIALWISRTGIVIVFHVPIDVVTELALTLCSIALSVAVLAASGLAALANVGGAGPAEAWCFGGAVALLLLALGTRSTGPGLLAREVDLVADRRRAWRGLPPLPDGPPRHAR
ncbi:MAG: hypothetical protein ACXVXP_10330 [Mycobacteriaceae bacterium]